MHFAAYLLMVETVCDHGKRCIPLAPVSALLQ